MTTETPIEMPRDARSLNPVEIRKDFPILNQTIHRDRPLVYFDNGASTQRPQSVIDAISGCYETTYANVHRGIHWLSEQSTHDYEVSRKSVADFLGSDNEREIVFTSGTTASINLVAHAWGNQHVMSGDEILLTEMEHHSNIVPWQQLAERTGAVVKFVPLDDNYQLDMESAAQMINERTKVFAFTAVSNVLGTMNPVQRLVKLAHQVGAVTLVDAAQHVPHDQTNVKQWDADFVVFSGHKMCGPSGVGVLFGKFELLDSMPPFLGGGSMISRVTTEGYHPGNVPARFEAGTPPIVEAIAMRAAIDYLHSIGLSAILAHEQQLARHAASRLCDEIDGLQLLRPSENPNDHHHTAGIVSFVIDGTSPQDISLLIDRFGIAIRAGHHCAMPLHEKLGLASSCRASFYLYNSQDEVDLFVDSLKSVVSKIR